MVGPEVHPPQSGQNLQQQLRTPSRRRTSGLIPRDGAHNWANLTDESVRTLVTFTPGGIEQMFKELADVFAHGIEELAAQYETYLVTQV